MALEGSFSGTTGSTTGGGVDRHAPNTPGFRWIAGWTLLVTAAIPIAMLAAAPLAAFFHWLLQPINAAGLWAGPTVGILKFAGYLLAFALILAVFQAAMMRRALPGARGWFAATFGGILAGGLVAAAGLLGVSAPGWDPYWLEAAFLLIIGLALGLAQWLVLRRSLPNAGWIILIDGLAPASIMLAGKSFTNFLELAILFFPGLITGAGLGLLLRQASASALRSAPLAAAGPKRRKFPRLAWVTLALVALLPLFFGFSWVYAVSQLALAKQAGVYPTVEAAIIDGNSQGWGGAQVVRIEGVHASPNRRDGSQPHVWFGGATIYLDRAPQGYDWTQYPSGSFYIHVREGWVHIPEGALPEFIGWAMELYGLEGVER